MASPSSPPLPYWDPSLYPMQGGCGCGLLRYEMLQAPMVVNCCHCTSCQRETGTAFALNGFIESDQVKVIPSSISPVKAPFSMSEPTSQETLNSTLVPEWTGATKADGSVEPIFSVVPSKRGGGVRMAKCPRCLVCVWCHYDSDARDATMAIRIGTLDRAWLVQPDVHIFTKSKMPFVALQDGKPTFDGAYEDIDFFRPESSARFKAMAAILIDAFKKTPAFEEMKAAAGVGGDICRKPS